MNTTIRILTFHVVAIRDQVEIGREYRYREEELEYHYTKDLGHLDKIESYLCIYNNP